MNSVSSAEIKKRAGELGADLCGIASLDRFWDAPNGFHPTDIIRECKSVIAIALRFPQGAFAAPSQAVYTFVHNRLVADMDLLTYRLSLMLESQGIRAVPIPASEPYVYWDDSRRHGQGILSLKHAAVRAGLGTLGKNTLLLNRQFGNMLLLGAVLCERELAADPVTDYQLCPPECRICLEACPAGALDGTTVEQRKCRSICGRSTEGGGFVYNCNRCRKLCAVHQGVNKKEDGIL